MKNYTRRLSISAVIAALYVCLSLLFKPISYGAIQFRISEVLNLMAFIDPVYGVGVTLGCLISNLFSEFGLIDVAVGTSATALAVFFISKSRNIFVASLWPTIFSGVMVGLELTYMLHTPLWFNIACVALGQFVVVTCIGCPLFKYVFSRDAVMRVLRGNSNGH